MSRVAVEPRLILWAVERAGLRLSDLERKFPKVRDWATGDVAPTLRQLEDFAKTTAAPVGYFFLPEPPEEKLPVADFRTVADAPARRPSPNLLETGYLMQQRQDFMRAFLIEEGHEPLALVAMERASGEAAAVAQRMRDALGLVPGWARDNRTWTEALANLRDAAECAGVLVVINGVVGNNIHRRLDPEDFRGFALVDEYAPLVFVNGADARAAQIFTLAHELAHICTGEPGISGLPRLGATGHAVERFCNRVAAEFLVPETELRALWQEAAAAEEPFQVVARHFKVSSLVAARRAYDLGLVDRDLFRRFFDAEMARARARRRRGRDFWTTQRQRIGRRFGQAVVLAAQEGRLLYRDAYQLCGLCGSAFDRFAELVAPQAVQ